MRVFTLLLCVNGVWNESHLPKFDTASECFNVGIEWVDSWKSSKSYGEYSHAFRCDPVLVVLIDGKIEV
jgi:hypothetical protein